MSSGLFLNEGITQKSGAARASTNFEKYDKFKVTMTCQKRLSPGCHLN